MLPQAFFRLLKQQYRGLDNEGFMPLTSVAACGVNDCLCFLRSRWCGEIKYIHDIGLLF